MRDAIFVCSFTFSNEVNHFVYKVLNSPPIRVHYRNLLSWFSFPFLWNWQSWVVLSVQDWLTIKCIAALCAARYLVILVIVISQLPDNRFRFNSIRLSVHCSFNRSYRESYHWMIFNNFFLQGFNIYINGSFHCCLRYKQLHSLHEQLKRSLMNLSLPQFPPKKLLTLTHSELEHRRLALERYMQLSESL